MQVNVEPTTPVAEALNGVGIAQQAQQVQQQQVKLGRRQDPNLLGDVHPTQLDWTSAILSHGTS